MIRVEQHEGPSPKRDNFGRVAVQFGQFPDCEEIARTIRETL